MNFQLKKEVGYHQLRPPFYGRAYDRPESDTMVCYPIPLNWLIGWAREIRWYFVRGPHGFKDQELRALLRQEYGRGFEHGKYEEYSYHHCCMKSGVGDNPDATTKG